MSGARRHGDVGALIAVGFALAAAAAFAGAAILQQEATQSIPAEDSLRFRLIIQLLRRPRWLAGIGLLVCGYGLQALALANGPVALVQPIVATEIALAIPLGMLRRRRRAVGRDWLGIFCVLAGVSLFLLVASPASGITEPGMQSWLASLIPVAGCALVMVSIARSSKGPRRAMLLGATAGLAFGALSVLTKAAIHEIGHGRAFSTWPLYVVIGVGILALVTSQSAYQAGPLAYSMPFIALLEPIVAVLIGDTVLKEQVRLAGTHLAAEAISAGIASVGIVLLATSPTVLQIYAERRETGEAEPGSGGDGRP